jgi:hypothetical protein
MQRITAKHAIHTTNLLRILIFSSHANVLNDLLEKITESLF